MLGQYIENRYTRNTQREPEDVGYTCASHGTLLGPLAKKELKLEHKSATNDWELCDNEIRMPGYPYMQDE